jgi:hypothetical protein
VSVVIDAAAAAAVVPLVPVVTDVPTVEFVTVAVKIGISGGTNIDDDSSSSSSVGCV